MPKPNWKDILLGVIAPLILLLVVVTAIAYAIRSSIHDEATDVKMQAMKAVEQKAEAGKQEILNEVHKQTETTKRLDTEFHSHQSNAMNFQEKVGKQLRIK